jgi:hypothetical protein
MGVVIQMTFALQYINIASTLKMEKTGFSEMLTETYKDYVA